jgi:hypothetical protein
LLQGVSDESSSSQRRYTPLPTEQVEQLSCHMYGKMQ